MGIFKKSLFCALFIVASVANAQDFKCGTVVPPHITQYIQQQQLMKNVTTVQNYTTCLNKEISLNILVVADSLNNVPGGIYSAVQNLNNHFDSICLTFKVCNIDTIYAYKYFRWHAGYEEQEFVTNYAMENVINVALVGQIIDPQGAAGYAPLGAGPSGAPHKDLIVIQANSFGGKTGLHEFGHYFGLFHTFDTSNGLELVNGSNCTTTGDLVCDTPADINPAPVIMPCAWNGTNQDPNGDYYTPLLGNIMSYHGGGCPLFFTREQYNRMIFCYLNFRNYLY